MAARLPYVCVLAAALGACGPAGESGADGSVTDEACADDGATRCSINTAQVCSNGFWTNVQDCGTQVCHAELGCVACDPDWGKTCVGDDSHACNADGTVGELLETCEFEQCQSGVCGGTDECGGATQLIYVVDDTYRLLSFDPANDHTFTLLGNLDCPAGPSWPEWGGGVPAPATPFSMSVDRTGRAWVLYTSGEIFWVPVTDVDSCTRSPFTPGSQGFELFGMGFVSDAPGSATETLYIAGGTAQDLQDQATGRLASVHPTTTTVTPIGTLAASEFGPELTGTGNAELWGYYPGLSSVMVGQLNKTTAGNDQSWNLPGLGNQVRAWAFAHWGGRYYIFITTQDLLGNTTSQVQRFDPATGNAEVILPDIPYIIVGAGVSTCAPVVVP